METPSTTPARDRSLAGLYAATIFTSAFLLFQVQPLVSKQLLPWFGGSPAVWTTCLLFFQTVLFAGYVYAHVSQHWLRPRLQAVVHLAILVIAVALLRVLPDASWEPPGDGNPVWRILWTLAATVGLPFFVLSTTAPLVQAWFARSFPGRLPYRLYALSNFGSLLALLSYPVFFERQFDLPEQAWLWSWAFVVYVALCGYAALRLWNIPRWEGEAPAEPMLSGAIGLAGASPSQEIGRIRTQWKQFALWLLLPAFASVALMATTNHVCTDVAVVPFLWVVPLALYLVTFIIAFDHPRWYRRTLIAVLTLAAIYGTVMVNRQGLGKIELFDCATTGRIAHFAHDAFVRLAGTDHKLLPESPSFRVDFVPFLVLNFAALFGICLLCHGELARRKPHPRFLTSYYLMIAAGGALGGAAVTLVAPLVFKTFFEWRLAMFLAAVAALALVLHAILNWRTRSGAPRQSLVLLVLLLPTALALVDLVEYMQSSDVDVLLRERNFFGALSIRVRNRDSADELLVLQHGVTTHGSQFVEPARRGLPTTYYSTISGVGRTLNHFRETPDLGGLRVGGVGLGTGTLAAYVAKGDSIRFYDINSAVVEIADSGRWFTYLADCRARGGESQVELGDARLTLKRELKESGSPRFHVLVLDAFSGDAVPVHLLTEEAFAIYAARLATATEDGIDGALAVHISNRYLDLEPVVRAAAERCNFRTAMIHNSGDPKHSIYSSDWIILTRNEALLAALEPNILPPLDPLPPAILWTDGRSNLFDVLK